MDLDMLPEGPLYLEVGNGIKHVMEKLSKKTYKRSSERSSEIDFVVLRGRFSRFIDTRISNEELFGALTMLSCLPYLKQLCLRRLQIPIPALTNVLLYDELKAKQSDYSNSKQQGLEELELRSICLSGSRREMEELAQALKSHSSLKKISLADCRPEGGSCRHLDSIFLALAKMPRLEELELDLMELPRWLNSQQQSFQGLIQYGNLRSLTMSYMRIPESYITILTEALKDNHVLKHLYLDRCDSLTRQSTLNMAQMLRENSCLEKLKLVVKKYEDAIPIAEALETSNSTLTALFLRSYHQLEVSPQVYEAFLSMTQRNYSLQELYTFIANPMIYPDVHPTMKFYLTLNKAGRGKLMGGRCGSWEAEEAPNEEWIETIISTRADTACSYYFLSHNPTVVDNALQHENARMEMVV